MQLGRCPICHNRIALEAVVQDEAGRELLALLATTDKAVGTALVSYLGLFRSTKRDLANDRALKLAKEALQLAQGPQLLPALTHTLETMRAKQQSGQFKPLANHNYLKRVLESDQGPAIEYQGSSQPVASKAQKRAAMSQQIMNIKDTDW